MPQSAKLYKSAKLCSHLDTPYTNIDNVEKRRQLIVMAAIGSGLIIHALDNKEDVDGHYSEMSDHFDSCSGLQFNFLNTSMNQVKLMMWMKMAILKKILTGMMMQH